MEQRRPGTVLTSGLLVFLVAGSLLATEVQSVLYAGEKVVKLGQKWNITCSQIANDELSKIQWKRNGQVLSDDLSTGVMQVLAPEQIGNTWTSKLISTNTLERHEGGYTCLDNSNETHYLTIQYDLTIKVLYKSDAVVVLDCPDNLAGEWTKEGKPLEETDYIKPYKNGSVVVTFEALDSKNTYGNYTCKVGENMTANYRVVRKPIVNMPGSTNVVEDEKLHLHCQVASGDPGLKIVWNVKGVNYTSSSGRVELKKDEDKNQMNGILHIDAIKMEDRGEIICYGFYNVSDNAPHHFDNAITMIRVKDKLAALWPFLGIVAEVVILCAIILIYEKKRNKSELEESDTDQSPDTKPTPSKDSADVRQRK